MTELPLLLRRQVRPGSFRSLAGVAAALTNTGQNRGTGVLIRPAAAPLGEGPVLEGELEAAIAAFIDHTTATAATRASSSPFNVYFGRSETFLTEKRRNKQETI